MAAREKALLVYFADSSCGVCAADEPRAERLAAEMGIPAVLVEISAVREAAGQLNVFTVPAVLLLAGGREYHRQARFIDFDELRKRMAELCS